MKKKNPEDGELSCGVCCECAIVIARQHLVWFPICIFCIQRVEADQFILVHRRFHPALPQA